MMRLVGTYLPMLKRLYSSRNRADPNVLESPSKPGRISAKDPICQICWRMDARDWRLVCRVSMRMWLGIQIEGILFSR